MVLATDMSKHFEHLNKFVNKFSDQKATIPVTVSREATHINNNNNKYNILIFLNVFIE